MTENNTVQAEAQAEYEQLAHEMQDRERRGSLLPYEKSTMQAQLNAVAEKAFADPKQPATPTPSPEGPRLAMSQDVTPQQAVAPPVPAVRPLTHQQILRLLGVSPWAIEHGSALKSWRIPR